MRYLHLFLHMLVCLPLSVSTLSQLLSLSLSLLMIVFLSHLNDVKIPVSVSTLSYIPLLFHRSLSVCPRKLSTFQPTVPLLSLLSNIIQMRTKLHAMQPSVWPKFNSFCVRKFCSCSVSFVPGSTIFYITKEVAKVLQLKQRMDQSLKLTNIS